VTGTILITLRLKTYNWNMNKYTVAFIVLVVMLFAGIGILMKPTNVVPLSSSSSATGADQPADNNPTLKVVITLGSASLITGLVGLAVLGFMLAREDKPEQEQNKT
jgi:hypothetical protein